VYRDLKEHELQQLTDDELIAQIREGRAAGQADVARAALRHLVFGYFDTLLARARLKLPEAVAEDVAADALESAIKSAFDGESVGEFRAWAHTILARRIAEHYRSREGKPRLVPLPGQSDSEHGNRGDEPSVEPQDGTIVDLRNAILRAYGELSEPHRAVVDLYIFSQYSAAEASTRTGETAGNVHQIGSRFRKRVRRIMDTGNAPSIGR
jgi:RNA polymerase sigma factor (sigma-70 family)